MKLSGTIRTPVKLQGDLIKKPTLKGFVHESAQVVEKDYNNLNNKPKIENVELMGDKSFDELGLKEITGQELVNIIEKVWR